MPITFHTQSYTDITFLTDIGKQLITLMGHTPRVPGAILAGDLPAALACLRSGLDENPSDNQPEGAIDSDAEPPLSLARHALPLIALLESAQADKKNVMWD